MKTTLHKLIMLLLLSTMCFIYFAGCGEETEKAEIGWLENVDSSISDKDKIGQLFTLQVDPISYFLYPDYRKNTNTLIAKYKPGGIFVYSYLDTISTDVRTEFNADKLHDEIIHLQDVSSIPLIIAANFEKGASHWESNATTFPFPLALSASRSSEMAYRQGKITAVEAKAQGINLIISPSTNLSIDPWDASMKLNSFGDDAEIVSQLNTSYIRGCQEVGLAASMKYYPSEESMSTATIPPDDISPEQLMVFKSAIEEGVMTVQGPLLSLPTGNQDFTSLFADWHITDILRKQLQFNGILFSEFVTSGNPNTVVKEADLLIAMLNAGNDMFILPETVDDSIPLIDYLINEVVDGNIDMQNVDTSVRRILELKNSMNLQAQSYVRLLGGTAGIGLPEYNQTARDISESAITILKNDDKILPINIDKYVVSITFLDDSSHEYASLLENKLDEITPNVKHIKIYGMDDQRIQNEAIRRAAEADIVICSIFLKPDNDVLTPPVSPEFVKLFNRISSVCDDVVAISFFNPNVINRIPSAAAYLNAYSPSQHSIEAAIDVIFGKKAPIGKSPVTVSPDYPLGFGLTY